MARDQSRTLFDVLNTLDPDAYPLRDQNGLKISGATLRTRVAAIGSLLRRTGVSQSGTVAVVLPNGLAMAVAFLGVATHAVCAPLNPDFGEAEFAANFDDLKPRVLILGRGIDSPARRAAAARGVSILEIDAAGCVDAPVGPGASVMPDLPRSDDTALILHTSGTTARPKQVPLTHGNLIASAQAVAASLALTATDTSLNVMPLFHIHGLVGVLLSSLHAGAAVICAPGYTASTFSRALADEGVTWYSAVPTIHQSVLEYFEQAGARPVHALRLIRSSSASLPPPVMARLERCFDVPVIEAYGMTEAAHQMASNPLPPAARKAGSVGRAAGPEICILDESGALLEQGRTGEVCIRGRNVMAGYLENPEANAKAFSNGWFRTGDQGYLDAEGYLFLTGRLKEIINRAGEKISPREVDEVLLEHPDVVQAVTFAVPHATIGEDVAAAVVLRGGAAVSESGLRNWLFDRLTPAKVPSRIVVVAAIPKGATGKVQRVGLHQKLAEALHAEHVPPRTPTEAQLAALWAELLQVDRVGITDNFFSLGGDSLRGARVISRLNQRGVVTFSVRDLFRTPTIEHLAAHIDAAEADRNAALLAFVESLSPEEVERMLETRGGNPLA